ncbi:MAG: hypothetical protein J0H11_03680 [Rhizobiales bacterium]|nr:hypothetical protein [Hyphomicrobiales bacterium]
MPNLKIYVDEAVWAERSQQLGAALTPVRNMLCKEFNVDVSLCHLAIVPVQGLSDQASVSAEIQILPRPERTNDLIRSACEKLRDLLDQATERRSSVRATALDPATYIALR